MAGRTFATLPGLLKPVFSLIKPKKKFLPADFPQIFFSSSVEARKKTFFFHRFGNFPAKVHFCGF
jgi:hypothetical protein